MLYVTNSKPYTKVNFIVLVKRNLTRILLLYDYGYDYAYSNVSF